MQEGADGIEAYEEILSTFEDVTLVGADGEVNVKKELLRVLSPVFAALLMENNVTRIDASDIKRQILLAFVTFIKTDRIEN